jgi:hypothetical protein
MPFALITSPARGENAIGLERVSEGMRICGSVGCLVKTVAMTAVMTATDSAEKRSPFKSTFTKSYKRKFLFANKGERDGFSGLFFLL